MPSAHQGDIHDYDFGPVIGAELSGRRPALIISNNGFNAGFGTAIALPMSSAMPAERYRTRQQVYVADAGSWASTRQVRAVHQRRLGTVMGRASVDELDGIIESLARRFTTTHRTGEVVTADGIMPIEAGTLWRLPVTGPGGGTFFTTVLVIDYNAGNNLAITVEVEEREPRPGSQVMCLYVKDGEKMDRAGAVINRLISMIQRPEA